MVKYKKKFRAQALLAALAVSPIGAEAADGVILYGKIDTDIEYQRAPEGTVAQMVDNASRWGLRGTETLNSDLDAVFGLEQGFSADNGAKTTPEFRNSYVGLASKSFGAIALGRLDSGTAVGSPIYTQNSNIIDYVIHDAGTTAIGTKVLNARNRVSNAFGYSSPSFGGLSMRARMNLGGPDPAVSTTSPIKTEDDIRQYDAAVDYAAKNFAIGVGYSRDSRTGGFTANTFRDKVQAAASYNIEPISLYAVAGRDRYAATRTSRDNVYYWLTGISFESGAHKLMLNYMERKVQLDQQGTLKKIQAGYRYSLSKRTAPYVFYDREDPNSNQHGNLITTVGVGIIHTF